MIQNKSLDYIVDLMVGTRLMMICALLSYFLDVLPMLQLSTVIEKHAVQDSIADIIDRPKRSSMMGM